MVVKIGRGGQIKKVLKPEYDMKELFHLMNQYHQLPEQPSLKWLVRVTNLETVCLVLNATG